jgi:hypothetical protein
LIDASWELLAGSSTDWKQGRINAETIATLTRYATGLDHWYKEYTLLFQRQPDLLGHVHRYSLFLNQAIQHLVQLHNADRIHLLVSRLNVCELRLELVRAQLRSYIADRLGIDKDQE